MINFLTVFYISKKKKKKTQSLTEPLKKYPFFHFKKEVKISVRTVAFDLLNRLLPSSFVIETMPTTNQKTYLYDAYLVNWALKVIMIFGRSYIHVFLRWIHTFIHVILIEEPVASVFIYFLI